MKGGCFPFSDKQFAVVISNAVIEHVGGHNEQVQFLNEMLRVGSKVYFSTPAKEFPLEIHTNFPFIHWLPKQYFDKIITYAGKPWASGNYMNLLFKTNLKKVIAASNAHEFQIIVHKFGPFPLHYIVVAQ